MRRRESVEREESVLVVEVGREVEGEGCLHSDREQEGGEVAMNIEED